MSSPGPFYEGDTPRAILLYRAEAEKRSAERSRANAAEARTEAALCDARALEADERAATFLAAADLFPIEQEARATSLTDYVEATEFKYA